MKFPLQQSGSRIPAAVSAAPGCLIVPERWGSAAKVAVSAARSTDAMFIVRRGLRRAQLRARRVSGDDF